MIVNVQRVLEEAVQETLEELVGDDDQKAVAFHLSAQTCYTVDEDGVHINEQVLWRLNLFVTTVFNGGHRHYNVTSAMPYDSLSDGDRAPLIAVVRKMWDNYQFGDLFMANNLESIEQAVTNEE